LIALRKWAAFTAKKLYEKLMAAVRVKIIKPLPFKIRRKF
jgi:hypothetical protein